MQKFFDRFSAEFERDRCKQNIRCQGCIRYGGDRTGSGDQPGTAQDSGTDRSRLWTNGIPSGGCSARVLVHIAQQIIAYNLHTISENVVFIGIAEHSAIKTTLRETDVLRIVETK